MVSIPKRNGTIDQVNQIEYGDGEPSRGYLGMSSGGESCLRKLWYNFHWCSPNIHNARTERIFEIGHQFEAIAIADLKKVGVDVFRRDSEGRQRLLTGAKGEQQEELIGFAGHSKGHPDGRVLGLAEMPHIECLLELKTMKDKKFNDFKKHGIQKSNHVYYCQTQRYMHEMGLSWCFFLAINKDTCEYHWEFIEYDIEEAKELVRREKIVLMSDEPLEKAYESSHYLCGFCNHYAVCHAGKKPLSNCRNCNYSDIENNGIWSCSLHEKKLSKSEQWEGCNNWRVGWGLEK